MNFLNLFKKKYLEGLQTKLRKGNNFVFESVDLLYCSLHKIIFNRSESYEDSPDWIKHKKVAINPKFKDSNCFRDASTAAFKL